jgi:chromosome segregation ATPase
MNSPIKLISNLIIIGIVVAAGVYFFAPGLWTEAEKKYRETAGWTEEAKRSQPIRYLTHTLDQTKTEFNKIDGYIGEHQVNIRKLSKDRDQSQTKADAATGLLAEMKEIYKAAKIGEKSWPVDFRGAAYNEQQFNTQLETLWNEKKTYSNVASKLTGQVDKLSKKLGDIRKAKAEYNAKISSMEADLAIARANVGSSDIDDIISKADDVMAFVDATSADFGTPMRTIDELMKENDSSGTVLEEGLQVFLNN